MDSPICVLLLVGPSQVGKSSFIKALAPQDVAKHILIGDGGGMSTTSDVSVYKFSIQFLATSCSLIFLGQTKTESFMIKNTKLWR